MMRCFVGIWNFPFSLLRSYSSTCNWDPQLLIERYYKNLYCYSIAIQIWSVLSYCCISTCGVQLQVRAEHCNWNVKNVLLRLQGLFSLLHTYKSLLSRATIAPGYSHMLQIFLASTSWSGSGRGSSGTCISERRRLQQFNKWWRLPAITFNRSRTHFYNNHCGCWFSHCELCGYLWIGGPRPTPLNLNEVALRAAAVTGIRSAFLHPSARF